VIQIRIRETLNVLARFSVLKNTGRSRSEYIALLTKFEFFEPLLILVIYFS
jgi:hypothetical protein